MIGKIIGYKVHGDTEEIVRFAKVEGKEFHEGLNKMIYHCVSSYGNKFRLSIDEIEFLVD